jgi:HEAT repeat protein
MSTESGRRISESDLRLFAHQVIDKVGRLRGPLRQQAAQEALESAPNDAARQTILELAVSAPDDVTAAFVQAAVHSGESQVARAAADLLLDIKGAPNALQIVSECLRSEDSGVRRRAVEALDGFSDPGALNILAAAIESQDASVRRAAVNSLGLMLGTKYHPLKQGLLASLSDPASGLAGA